MTSLIDMRLPAGDWTSALVGSASTAALAYFVLKSPSADVDVTLHGDVTKPPPRLRRDDLFSAAWRGDVRQLDVILERTILDVNTPNEEGMTPVFLAAEAEQTSAIRYLHSLQAELNVQNKQGRTPLMHAVRNGKAVSARVLIEQGADVNITCPTDGCTALVYAAMRSDVTLVKLLLKHRACANVVTLSGDSPLTIAVDKDCLEVVRALIFRLAPADVNVRLPDGSTPLMLAARSTCDRVAFLLLSVGACVNARRTNGDSALLVACANGSYDVTALLLRAGADVHIENRCGMTCLQLVTLQPQRSALRELLQRHGARRSLSLVSKVFDNFKRFYHQHYTQPTSQRPTKNTVL